MSKPATSIDEIDFSKNIDNAPPPILVPIKPYKWDDGFEITLEQDDVNEYVVGGSIIECILEIASGSNGVAPSPTLIAPTNNSQARSEIHYKTFTIEAKNDSFEITE